MGHWGSGAMGDLGSWGIRAVGGLGNTALGDDGSGCVNMLNSLLPKSIYWFLHFPQKASTRFAILIQEGHSFGLLIA